MYKKVSTALNFVDREKEVLAFWDENSIFQKSIDLREGAPVFTFYDGPPTANGMPHIGHVLTRAVKDIIPRYKTMKGYKVLRKAGWDTHGLPVELEVEKQLGINGKPEIEKYGIEPFIKKCKESVWKYEKEWKVMSKRVGFWADMENPYVTYHNSYIESVWWAIKNIFDKGLIYKGHKVVPYCPRCGTALSTHEVAQGYKDVKEKSIFVRFKVSGTENDYFMAWTTTPWTLPSNVALTVNAKEEYARVEYKGDYYYVAKALAESVFKADYTILETKKGAELEGMSYEPLFDYVKTDKKGFYIVCDDYVTLTDGSGIVHTAPAFGEDDSRVGRKYDLPFVQLVDGQGQFVEAVTDFAGMFVKDADPHIIKKLKEDGKLFHALDYEHSYPFCWRCDTPLLYYARSAWFIKMTEVKERLLANNDTINWIPDNVKHGRFGKWLENDLDWGLSRERYWGTPLPIWECECGHLHAIGSVEELRNLGGDDVPADIELHKPYIDKVTIDCPKCGKKMSRVEEVIDCWFDSGAMPFAQWHYPFENKEIFEQNFPANFISEAVDQTRGWFYTLHAISCLLFDKAAYENVIVLGHVQDKEGQKMSKHKGNVVNPDEFLSKQGADAVRWFFYSNGAPWLPSRFSEDAVNEGQRKFMGTFWNTYAFYVLYAEIDQFNPRDYKLDYDSLAPMDRWILSKLNSLIKFVDKGLEDYKITETSREINDFVDELSNWYVRRSRERFWVSGMPQDKVNAYMTLYTVLVNMTRVIAPFVPFMAEAVYQNLVVGLDNNAVESVHLCDFPAFDESLIDRELEKNMDLALNIVAAGRAARNTSNIKNRQPIGLMYVNSEETLPPLFNSIVLEELNVKKLEYTNSLDNFTSYSFKPQLKTLGKKYGKLVPAIGKMLSEQDGNALMKTLNEGEFKTEIDGEEVVLSIDDVLIEVIRKDNFVSESGKGVVVVLDTTLTPELIEEGFVRELISKIQTMRKEADFEVLDKIQLSINTTKTLEGVIERNIESIKADVLANEVLEAIEGGYSKSWNINGEETEITVKKI